MIEWTIKGREFVNCNCAYGCPCQFNALPTDGTCKAAIGYQFTEGRFGDVDLSGLRGAGVYAWPGAVNEPLTNPFVMRSQDDKKVEFFPGQDKAIAHQHASERRGVEDIKRLAAVAKESGV